MTEKEMQAELDARGRDLYAQMSDEDLQFLIDNDHWEDSPFVYHTFNRYGGLWYLGYIKQQLQAERRK